MDAFGEDEGNEVYWKLAEGIQGVGSAVITSQWISLIPWYSRTLGRVTINTWFGIVNDECDIQAAQYSSSQCLIVVSLKPVESHSKIKNPALK